MIGAILHTVQRVTGEWSTIDGSWRQTGEKLFKVLGVLEGLQPIAVIMDPLATGTRARWKLTLAHGEPELVISEAPGTIGDRLIYGDRWLTAVSRHESAPVGSLPSLVYELVDPGHDSGEVSP